MMWPHIKILYKRIIFNVATRNQMRIHQLKFDDMFTISSDRTCKNFEEQCIATCINVNESYMKLIDVDGKHIFRL